jgi:hypothetical protein
MPGSGPITTEVDAYQIPVRARYTAPIAAGSGTSTIKSGPGRLCCLVVTATGTGLIVVFDNTSASGLIIAALPASPALGEIPIDLPFFTGLTISAPASSPAVTVGYS